MARSFGGDLRERFLQAVANGMTARAAGRRFAIAPTTAIRWTKRWREDGERTSRVRGKPSQHGKLAAHATFLLGLYQQQGDLTLHEMVERLAKARGVRVHPASLWRFFNRHDVTRKKRRRTPPSRTKRG